MKITPIAHTWITAFPDEVENTEFGIRASRDLSEADEGTAELDILAEMTGRGCYKSWKLPNPDTADNEGYTSNVLDHMHFSVFEHGTVTFWVEGVSRALLLELERHRHISFSVESQRYVNTRKVHAEPVYPPLWDDLGDTGVVLKERLRKHYEKALDEYDDAYNGARDAGLPVKVAREAARAFLLESTPVDFFVTGNLRAWMDVLGKRHSTHADAEIQQFASKILGHLRVLAPNSFQNISDTPND